MNDSTMHCELMLDGHPESLTAEYALLFVQQPDGPPLPVLYYRGRRVIRAWSVHITHEQPADPWGCSG